MVEAGRDYLEGGLQAVLWAAGHGPSSGPEVRAQAREAYEEAILEAAAEITRRREGNQ